MKFSELPDGIRVKLSDRGERDFWMMVDEFGGVKDFSGALGYDASKVYNWRSKDVFLPVEAVRRVLGSNATEEIEALKGGGRSRPIEDPEFPFEPDDELLTRVESSVHVNGQGVPVYQSSDTGLVDRFYSLLQQYGRVPVELYSRSVYELRYPKYLQQLFSRMGHSTDFAALVDEEGRIGDGYVEAGGRRVAVDGFGGRLYSRDKRLQLAMERGDSQSIAELMAEEADRVSSMF